jgi:hypothetical protein
MKVVLFFIAIAGVIYGLFWYARNEGYLGALSREEKCPEVAPDITDDGEYNYGYGDRLKDAAEGCL